MPEVNFMESNLRLESCIAQMWEFLNKIESNLMINLHTGAMLAELHMSILSLSEVKFF